MSLLSVVAVEKGFGSRTLFQGVSMGMESGENVGLIGANGSGKTTLLRMIAGEEPPDAGEIAIRRTATVGYLSQEPEFDPEHTILEVVEGGRPDLQALLTDYHRVTSELAELAGDRTGGEATDPPGAPGGPGKGVAGGADLDRLFARQSELSARIDREDGWDWEHRAQAMLTRVGLPDWDRPTLGLSGGEKRRASLARVLLAEPDLLLLDEPTNHLDADTVLWLEEFLTDYPGSVLLITHDRYFLDRVVDRTYEVTVDEFVPYEGGYTEYLEEKAARVDRTNVEAAKRLKLIGNELEWAKRAPPARTGKQRARLKRIRELKAQQQVYKSRQTRDLALPERGSARLGRTILEVEGIAKQYGDQVLFAGVDLSLRAGERIGIIGPNGAGKTTLLRILLGEIEPDSGSVHSGVNTRVSYFDQRRAELNPNDTVYAAAANTDWVEVGGNRIHLRSYLDRFLFPVPRQQQKVSTLSGGERSRLILARLLLEPANLLVLDEPTNDLDLLTLQVLEDILLEFPGCVLLVTHDRFLLDKVATSMLAFDGGDQVVRIEGGYDRYRAWKEGQEAGELERIAARRERDRVERKAGEVASRGKPPQPGSVRRRLSFKENRELEALEALIETLEEERMSLETTLADPDFYTGAPEVIRERSERFAALKDELDEAFLRWTELEEIRDQG